MFFSAPIFPDLTEQEREVLTITQGKMPQVYSGNIMGNSTAASPYMSREQDQRAFNMRELLEESALGRPNSVQGPVQGLEKMQTLQRLAKFENPMQNLARSRLEEFSVNKIRPISLADNPTSALEVLLKNKENNFTVTPANFGNDTMEIGNAGPSLAPPPGTLNRGYQFPSGIVGLPSSQNPLQRISELPPPRGPQPLTAGPPGQRQSTFMPARPGLNPIHNHNWNISYSFNYGHSASNSLGYMHQEQLNPNTLPSSPWNKQYLEACQPQGSQGPRPQAILPHDPDAHKTKDTLPWAAISHYYPFGGPVNLNFDATLASVPLLTPEEQEIAKQKNIEDSRYSGHRLWGMTMDEHEMALLEKKARFKNPHGPVSPPSPKESFKIVKPITPEEINNMTLAEAAAPLFNMMYKTLLEYNQDDTSYSRSSLSKWVKSTEDLIDDSLEGRKSFFGEDWGAPAKGKAREG
jgi:hypothetical protein